MSARPAFSNLAAQSLTRFVGDINPWTQKPMKLSTAHLGNSPFPPPQRLSAVKPDSKPGPKTGTHRKSVPVDVAKLVIRKNIPLPEKRRVVGKYERLFSKLKPKDAVQCKPEQVNTVDQALRNYLKDTGQQDKYVVLRQQSSEENLNVGYVWLWPIEEAHLIPDWGPAKGGRATSAKKTGAKQ